MGFDESMENNAWVSVRFVEIRGHQGVQGPPWATWNFFSQSTAT